MLKDIKKLSYIKILTFFFYLFLFLVLLNNSFSYLDPDLGWHLKIGEQILNEKQVPSYQYYDYTLGDAKWVDHEWLFNLFLFVAYDNLGYIFVNIFFALLALGVFILLNSYILKNYFSKKNILLLYFFEGLGLFGMLPNLGVRMQEISVLFLLIELILIHNYSENRNYKKLLLILPLYLVWVNLHAGFILGIFIFFFWLGIKIFEKIISKTKLRDYIEYKKYSTKDLLAYFSIGVALLLSTFFTPYFYKLHLYLSGVFTNTEYMLHISEWLPIFYVPIINNQLIYAVVIGAVLFLTIYYSFFKGENRKINLWHFSLSLLFLGLAFKSKRHFPLFFIISLPPLMLFFSKEFIRENLFIEKLKGSPIIKSFLLTTLIICIGTTVISINFTEKPFSNERFCSYSPCEAVDFLKNSKEYRDLKMFNNYGEGGFLIWQWPEKKLFIDGRFPQYKFAEHSLIEEYELFLDEEKIEDKLNEYNIEMVLLRNPRSLKIDWLERIILGVKEDILPGTSALFDYLESSDGWKKVFANKLSGVYVRK